MERIGESKYAVNVVLKGKDYDAALSDYVSYLPEYLTSNFDDRDFPKGKVPLTVLETTFGDEIYRYIFIKKFPNLLTVALRSEKKQCKN